MSYAKNHPDRNVIGVEVRKLAVQVMQERLEQTGINNIKLLHGNGTVCLSDMFADGLLDTIFIFHPDPWLKRRHNKRRLISDEFLTLAHKKLKVGGKMYISTDVKELWNDISKRIARQSNLFSVTNNDPFWANNYTTRWDELIKKKQRQSFCATFVKLP
jgi:tRNA (guanine-N(7)-)-methyltransferase